ncbi:MAG: annexin [archaeon]|nr:annexin [archaeon]
MQSLEECVKKLKEACEKKSIDKMIDIIKKTTRHDRELARKAYDEQYDIDLIGEIKKQFSGNEGDLLRKIFLSRAEYDAEELQRSFKAFNIDEDAIYEILLDRPNYLIKEIEEEYKKINGKPIEKAIIKNLDNKVKKPILAILNTERSENTEPNKKDCEKKADMLVNENPEKWLSNDKIVNTIFAQSSPCELTEICRYYGKKTNTHILLKSKELSKSQRKFLAGLFFNLISPAEHYAYRLQEACKGIGTNNELLDKILVTRHDLDMGSIKGFYHSIYEVTAREDIEDDTKGDYRKLLIALLNYESEEDK